MKTRACFLLVPPLAGLLLGGCLATTPPAKPKPTPPANDLPSSNAAVNLLPSSSAAVISSDVPATPVPETQDSAEPAVTAAEVPVPPAPAPAVESTQPAELPGAGRILRVNTKLHYVLLDVSGRLLAGQDVVVFRDGEAVGRLRISSPRQGRYASADILDGDVREGDLVK
jgi:hypothetical protein